MKNIFNRLSEYMDSDRAELHGSIVALAVLAILSTLVVVNFITTFYGNAI
jgi:hypothetical protein